MLQMQDVISCCFAKILQVFPWKKLPWLEQKMQLKPFMLTNIDVFPDVQAACSIGTNAPNCLIQATEPSADDDPDGPAPLYSLQSMASVIIRS